MVNIVICSVIILILLINNSLSCSITLLDEPKKTEIVMKTNQSNTHNTNPDINCGPMFIKLMSINYGSTINNGFCIDSQDRSNSCGTIPVPKTL